MPMIPSLFSVSTELAPATVLARLLGLRLAAIAIQTGLILWVHQGIGMALPLLPMLSVPALLLLFSVTVQLRLQRRTAVGEHEIFLHLLVDTSALLILLFYSGGASNPFASLLLLPIVISATLLQQGFTWVLTGLAVAAYTGLMRYSVPLPLPLEGGVVAAFALHVLGMWLNFIGSALLVAVFVTHLASTVREKERRLAETRATALQQEHVVMLGALAAGAAHELSTPLASIRLIATELAQALHNDPEYGREVELLREQTERCKQILSQLTLQGGVPRGEAFRVEDVRGALQHLVDAWRTQHPGIPLNYTPGDAPAAPRICLLPSVRQALWNLLDNAAEASPQAVEFRVSWDAQELTLIVQDRGAAIAPGWAESMGKPFFSTKTEGMGLGLYLTQTTLRQLGGQWEFTPSAGQGSEVRVRLPLARLQPDGLTC